MFWNSLRKKILTFFSNCKPYLTFISLSISFFYFTKYFQQKIPNVKFSYFLIGLSKNLVTELYIYKNNIKFRGPTDNWYQTDCSLLSSVVLSELIRTNSHVRVNKAETILQTPTLQNFVICSLGFLLTVQLKKLLGGENIEEGERGRGVTREEEEGGWEKWVGAEHVMKELKEVVVERAGKKKKLRKLGARTKKCFLILGPSGSGKTSLAKNLASHLSLPLFIPSSPCSFPIYSSSLLLIPTSSIMQSFSSLLPSSSILKSSSTFLSSFLPSSSAHPNTSFSSLLLIFEKARKKGCGIILIDDLDLKDDRFLSELAREMRKIREDGGDAIVIATARKVRKEEGRRKQDGRGWDHELVRWEEDVGKDEEGRKKEVERRKKDEEGRREENERQREEKREEEGLNRFWLRLFDDVFYLNYPTIEEKFNIMDKILEKRGVSLEVNRKDLRNLLEQNKFLKSFSDIDCFVDKIMQEKRIREEAKLIANKEVEEGMEEEEEVEEKQVEWEDGEGELEEMVGIKEEDTQISWDDVERGIRKMKMDQVEEVEG